MDRRRIAALVVLPVIAAFALRPVSDALARMRTMNDEEAELTGRSRPRQIPADWVGEPLPNGEGWRWSDPRDRGNAVRMHRGHADAPDLIDRNTYVVITVKSQLIDGAGQPTGEYLHD